MPPKFDPTTPENASLISLFTRLGLSSTTATELVRQPKAGPPLKALIDKYGLDKENLNEKQGTAIAKLASGGGKLGEAERGFIVQKVVKGDIKTVDQVAAAIKMLESNPTGTPVNEKDFDKTCGVGVDISLEQLPDLVKSYMSSIPAPESWTSLGPLLGGIKSSASDLKWANPVELKNSLETIFTELFGTKEAAAAARAEAQAKAKSQPSSKPTPKPTSIVAAASTSSAEASSSTTPYIPTNIFQEGFLSDFHKVGENPQIDETLKKEHLEWTKGKVHTRFPPEPNGFLHIGHVKAVMIDFGYAKYHGGRCYLRYDDTNPEKEEGRFFQSILETVRWLGFEPWKITYSSDNFQRLYELAVLLIKRGKGYVCTCDAEKIKEDRGGSKGNPVPCIHRDRPIEDSLVEFEKMKNGEYPEKAACLRMKMNLNSGNPYMWDIIAYRVKKAPHHRTADKWKIYPTYDFTHCLCDSFENITHSLCSTEFILARESYEWLCDAVSVYKPRQYEFARLNLQGTFLSKRKIARLVERSLVKDWDDPRLYTIIALRRRGIPPGALLRFVSELGVTTSVSTTELQKLESTVRNYLEDSSPRLMMILNPVKVILDNVEDDYEVEVEVPLHPKIPSMGNVMTKFSKEVYIDISDFRETDSPDYFRLAPNKSVGLFKAPFPITCTSFKKDPSTGEIVEIHANLEKEGKLKKAKAYIQWVNVKDAVKVKEVRYFHPLFKSEPPAEDYENDVNPNSLEVFKGAVIENGFYKLAKKQIMEAKKESEERTKVAKKSMEGQSHVDGDEDEPIVDSNSLWGMENVRFQAMRLAYFALDRESKVKCLDDNDEVEAKREEGDEIILNRIVSLKEDVGKKA